MNIKKISIAFVQIILTVLLLLSGFLLIYTRIPGNGAVCDADQMIYFLVIVVFTISSIGLLLSTSALFSNSKWKKYKFFTITLICLLTFLIFSTRKIMFMTKGEKEMMLVSDDFYTLEIQLYKSGDFFSYSFDGISCEAESLGTYEVSDGVLKLIFKTKKPLLLGSLYTIDKEEVHCIDCPVSQKLKLVEK
ncbi:hypothetical protein H2O64_03385 [Kordia sp. YSTF-M3]|uniref:Uncharacterized protein n=1 Tax=Kordia aestuariivivens TaxID=2759037 RepID=A0ABR7Q5P3_9FLAO|nr:hypothetical protein [Kordia aestuariivivens]MBC8753696.1 hypothetical protein [Kordia aestuariivivens]